MSPGVSPAGGPARDARADRAAAAELEATLRRLGEVAIVWGVEDVREVRPDLDDDQALAVLDHVVRFHDASVGVCWDTLAAAAGALFPEEGGPL